MSAHYQFLLVPMLQRQRFGYGLWSCLNVLISTGIDWLLLQVFPAAFFFELQKGLFLNEWERVSTCPPPSHYPSVPLSFSINPPDSQVRAMPERTIDAYHWFSKLSVNRKPTQERVFCCIFTFKLVFQGYIVGISQYPIPTITSWGTST